VSVAAEAGGEGTYEGRLSFGHTFANGLGMLLSGTFYDPHGQRQLFFPEFNNPATNSGFAVNADDDEFHQLFANITWGHWTLHGVLGSRDKGIPTASFGTVFNVTGTRTTDQRDFLNLEYGRTLGRPPSIVRFLGQTFLHHAMQSRWSHRLKRRDSRRFSLQNRSDYTRLTLALARSLTRGHLVALYCNAPTIIPCAVKGSFAVGSCDS